MTDWKIVTGTTQPLELDLVSSPTTVYMRKNIQQVQRTDEMTNETITEYQYEERQMTVEEYETMKMMESVVQDKTTGIIESVTEFQKEAVIDEYTAQLIEEGVI